MLYHCQGRVAGHGGRLDVRRILKELLGFKAARGAALDRVGCTLLGNARIPDHCLRLFLADPAGGDDFACAR